MADTFKKILKLQKLPYLVHVAIFATMDPSAIFMLCQSSKRMRFTVKSITKNHRNDFWFWAAEQLHTYFQDKERIMFSFHSDDADTLRRTFLTNFGETRIMNSGRVVFLSDDKLATAKLFLKELQELFTITYRSATFDLNHMDIPYSRFFEWFTENQIRFSSCRIEGNITNNQKAKSILSKLNISREIQIYAVINQSLKIRNWNPANEDLIVRNGHWFRPENLRSLSCVTVRLFDPAISDVNINAFIQRIIAGDSPNLQLLKLHFTREYDINVILGDVDVEMRDTNRYFRRYQWIEPESIFARSFTLQDGTEASISFFGVDPRDQKRSISLIIWR